MTYKIRIRKISWESVREIENLSISFVEEDPAIYLLQMQNGYGKTTTLTLLKHLFTGRKPEESLYETFRYKKSFGGNPEFSEFWMQIGISEGNSNEELYDIGLIINHDEKECTFKTVVPRMGLTNGWNLPTSFKRNFEGKKEFVSLFLFDGEMAKELNRSQGKNIIENSIRQVANLHPLFDLINDDGKLKEVLESEFSLKNPDKTMNKYTKQKQQLEDHIERIKEEQEKYRHQIDDIEKEIQELNNKKNRLESNQKDFAPQLEKYNTDLHKAKTQLLKKTNETVGSLLNPANNSHLWSCVRKFILSMEEARLPRSIGKRYIEDLLNQKACLCGKEWDDQSVKHVKKQMEYMLGDVLLGTVKSMQTEISDMGFVDSEALITVRNSLQAHLNDIKEIEQNIKILRSKYDEKAAMKLKEIEDQLRRHHIDLKEKKDDLRIIESTDRFEIDENGWDLDVRKADGTYKHSRHDFTKCFNLFTLKNIYDEIVDKISELTNTRDIKVGHDAIKDILTQTLEILMGYLREEVIDLANTILSKMHATGGGMNIRSLDNGLTFTNEMGINQDDVNVGAQLAAAYSYVAAMFSIGEIDMPLVLDSPVTGFSAGVCKDWGNEIPPRFNQIISFITSLEKIGIRSLLRKETTYPMTIRRKNEGLEGKPQTGEIIVDFDRSFYINYEFIEEDE